MKLTKKHKAQMEIMGLAIVVILVVIGITFMIAYSMKPASKTKEKFESGQLPETIITSLTESTTNCKDQSMANLIEDCGALGGLIECEDGRNSCQYVSQSMQEVLNYLLTEKLKYGYEVLLKRNGREDPDPEKIYFNVNCDTATMDIEAANQPLPNNVEIELRICRPRIG